MISTIDPERLTGIDKRWTRVADKLPPDGEMVITLSSGGVEQTLKWIAHMWFLPCENVAVLYTPILWRPI